ncbi:PSD1 and planctomycete cytochrome C domain-containing protein [soil metagenome]
MRALFVLMISGLFVVADDKKPDISKLPPASAKAIDFDKDVQPLLATHCFKCHGAEKQKGELRLDDGKHALAGGNSGAVIKPGKSAESALIHAVAGLDPDATMPPGEAKKLTKDEVGVLRAWIDQGAKWGTASATAVVTKSNHWSFRPINKPAGKSIDEFILARLAKEGLKPSPVADKYTLLRRVSLDLTGLPPTLKEIEDFEKDTSARAFETVVDRLLASPHYGERWGRHWLDVARYADSDGYEKDTGRPNAWRYRNWVIDALNRDLPYDQFTVQQLAGDLLPNATLEQKAATGFHRNTLTNKEGGVDQEEFRVNAVIDRVNTTSTAWLGLTMACCQCHDHKYDPVSQREFYQFFAFFNSDAEVDVESPLPEELPALEQAKTDFNRKTRILKANIAEAKELGLRSVEVKGREKELADHLKKQPQASKVPTLSLGTPRMTNVHIRGDFLRKGVAVSAGTPAVLPPLAKAQTRLDLARWIVANENPLTPRVAVNWTWAKFFGRGLVATPEDFGLQGQKPSHPELLDWLAATFRDDDQWSLKKLHKRIVMSATYQQATTSRPELVEKDPLNILLARQSRLRLEAEIVRDNALAAAGLLNPKIGGPSIRPPQPPGISELTYASSAKWVESKGAEKYKRGMYIWFQRTSPYPTLMTFDEPDSNVCVVRRERSNTPLQALTLLNDAVYTEAAQALAKRVWTEFDECDRLEEMSLLALSRKPVKAERDVLLKLLRDTATELSDKPEDVKKLLGNYTHDKTAPPNAAAWVIVARTILNLDEFVTRE